jgi:transcriptional regulator with XRE-family HTH domain
MATTIIASSGVEFHRERLLLGVSLRALAGELGISPTQLQRYERDPGQLDDRRLMAWGDALGNAVQARTAKVRRAATASRHARRVKQEG